MSSTDTMQPKEVKYKIPETLSAHLITEIEKYEYLWDTAAADYQNKEKKMQTYNNIANVLHSVYNTHGDFNGDEVYKKWQNLRSQYRRYVNKRDACLMSGNTNLMKKWKHAESLEFLEPIFYKKYRKDDCDINIGGGDLIMLTENEDGILESVQQDLDFSRFSDDYQSDSFDSNTNDYHHLTAASSSTKNHMELRTSKRLNPADSLPPQHNNNFTPLKKKKIKVEPYPGDITSIDITPHLPSSMVADRFDSFGSYVAAEIRALHSTKQSQVISDIFEVLKKTWGTNCDD